MLADGHNVYAYDPVLKTKVRTILTNFVSIQYIAVNKKTKAVFVADYNALATGKKYSVYINYVSINSTNKSEPFLQWVY